MKTEKPRCKSTIRTDTGFHIVRCSRSAVLDGFCKQHHPETQKARREKADEAYRKKFNPTRAAFSRIAELEAENAELKSVLVEIRDAICTCAVTEKARDALAKLEGRT